MIIKRRSCARTRASREARTREIFCFCGGPAAAAQERIQQVYLFLAHPRFQLNKKKQKQKNMIALLSIIIKSKNESTILGIGPYSFSTVRSYNDNDKKALFLTQKRNITVV